MCSCKFVSSMNFLVVTLFWKSSVRALFRDEQIIAIIKENSDTPGLAVRWRIHVGEAASGGRCAATSSDGFMVSVEGSTVTAPLAPPAWRRGDDLMHVFSDVVNDVSYASQ